MSFTIIDKHSESENKFNFALNYWPSFVDVNGAMNSGAYVFRTIDNLFATLPYSQLKNAFLYKGTFMSKMIMNFEKQDMRTKEVSEKATVHITLDQDFKVAKFDVDLDSIPGEFLDGYEVTATFDAIDFDNNKTFYTDSNGLAMQERILNYRSYYNFTAAWTDENHPNHNGNVSMNYYPINSAISLKEVGSDRQFTVLNDRSQGGSSLQSGRIELMQHRRVPADDNKGVAENLNERDEDGNGIRVPASYYVQLSSKKDAASAQIYVQMKIDDTL
jgi:hypothetical protein